MVAFINSLVAGVGVALLAGEFFVHSTGDKHMILDRMSSRDHFMPPSLLESQLDTLEPLEPDEHGMDVDPALPVDRLAAMVLARLGLA